MDPKNSDENKAEDDEDDEDSIPLARLTNTDWNVLTGATMTVTFDVWV